MDDGGHNTERVPAQFLADFYSIIKELKRRNNELEERNAALLDALRRADERVALLERTTKEHGAPIRANSSDTLPPPAVPRKVPAPKNSLPIPSVAASVRSPAGATTVSRPASAISRHRVWLLTLGVYLLIALVHAATAVPFLVNRAPGTDAALWSLPLDDAYIHLDYARELAESGMLAYNDGIWEAGSTSPLWALVLGLLYRIFVMNGVHVALMAKAAGFAFAVGTSITIFHLARRVTDKPGIPLLVAVITALEPTFSFHKLSGMEGTLFAFVAGLCLLFLLQGRGWLLGISLGLIAWARPEGFVLIGLVSLLVAAEATWESIQQGGLDHIPWIRLLSVFLPLGIFTGVWIIYNYSVNGSFYPNTYLAKHDASLGWFNPENLMYVWYGYNGQLPFFATPIATAGSIALFAFGAIFTVRRLGLRGLPVILFPWTVWYALSTTMKWGPSPWLFWTRRYADPALPFFILTAALGVAFIWASCVSLSRQPRLLVPRGGQLLSLGGLVALLGAVIFPLQGLPGQWLEYPKQYAWNCDNIDEVDSFAGRWLKENTAPDATVATWDAGAVRYFGERYTIDLVGLSFHQAVGRPYMDVVREFKPDYLFSFYFISEQSIPNAEQVLYLKPKLNTILGGGQAMLMKMDWDWIPDDKNVPAMVDLDGYRLVDSLDIGELKDNLIQEKPHNYKDSATNLFWEGWSKLTSSRRIIDWARAHPTPMTETFTMQATPHKPLALVIRYDGGVGGNADVYVNDRLVGEWELRPGEYAIAEDRFLIPAEFVTGDMVNLRLEWKKGLTDNYYWTYSAN